MKVIYCDTNLIKMHIAESLVISGLPMRTDIDTVEPEIEDFKYSLFIPGNDANFEKAIERGKKLGRAKIGSGHDSFLKGIVVTAIISLPSYQWTQLQRYHFLDIVSSQSKMHRLVKMDLSSQCNEEVDKGILEHLKELIEAYNNQQTYLKTTLENDPNSVYIKEYKENIKKLWRRIVNNCPQGLHLAAGIVTNYLQLKTIKQQRKGHKLSEWKEFAEWIDNLPYFKELTEVSIE